MNGKYGRDTRPVCDTERNMTGYGSKSRKAVRMTPRGNGKSGMTAVKFLLNAVGKEKASEIIAEAEKKMESDIEKDNGMDIRRDIADTDIEDMEVQ